MMRASHVARTGLGTHSFRFMSLDRLSVGAFGSSILGETVISSIVFLFSAAMLSAMARLSAETWWTRFMAARGRSCP